MGGPARALLGGFSTTTSSLEVGGRMAWPSNNPLDLNQTLSWGVGLGASGGGAAAMSAGVDNFTQESVTRAVMKEKNWPALLILVIIALTIGGNILVILAVSLEKKLQNATNFFLRSLAVADMLVGILVMPISLINILYDYAWPLPSALCPIWIYLDVLFSTASIMHLCAISLDRYVAIRNPIEHSRFNSRTKAMMKIAAVWTISIGVSMPIPVIGLHNEDKVFVNGSCVLNEERFMLIGSFVAFFIPLVIMVVTYCLTIQVLQRQATVFLYEAKTSSQQPLHTPAMTNTLQPPTTTFPLPQINTLAASDSQEIKPPPPQSRRNTLSCLKGAEPSILLSTSTPDSISIIPSTEVASQLSSPAAGPSRSDTSGCHGRRGMMQAIKNERRASKVLGIVFFLFLIMWCPFFITNVTFVLCRGSCNESLLHDLLNVFVWVGYISSGVNPLVYTLFNKTYRRAFSSYIRCQYKVGANAAGQSCKTLLVPPPCPSHAVTPLLMGSHGKAGVDRNSNCRNGGRGDNGRLTVDPEDMTDDETQIGIVSQSLSECHNIGMLSETEPETEVEQELSLISYSPASREHTSSV
ncbi:5-hydroxytryptamine (serotonin) receptor 2C, G protein-coupled-like 1 [Dicentrarchus labrax]|uniref:5-hydroxytryptamine (serotonin) receptor 2C, G protein-coupled-like 1 n=1 Tax=Dicentrarchus labrax TaxID=13489 RepID=A0A8C4D917_DICLA|nr:5-hydroxytryptamine (serotonin) receptor 2C, G protein-coupled-like 1 [Dicentrarchus labrax]XP_051256418.1 5-hydroxytryptamine (serotonin) receptor 2C, G protein-coupled-like 1 [Dicentrarchus labrax]XP_051256420.1 5-hydroxytryptamine (serotonin) receptor 2C, G protein-coupled-like 1 [Dicentrarchus labrax]XP_051256421.1 5-hydroxytryptamine (serotonin) receptor 2C, G protein-coupled-like 1 [Dicentrarchus labrax]XP_051256422.1 5-hydroxytryptamine (serotonin) receptor 2C, G protein-coupled-like 